MSFITKKHKEVYKLDSFLPESWQPKARSKDRTFQELLDGSADDLMTLIKFREFVVNGSGAFEDGTKVGFSKFSKEINLALDLYVHTNSSSLSGFSTRFSKHRLKLELSTYDKEQREKARQHLLSQMEAEKSKALEAELLAKAHQERLEIYGDKLGSW